MSIGTFVDKQHQPTMKEIFASIGSKKELWQNLTRFVADNYRIKSDLAFYGKNYGWALRFRNAGKALLSMYPGEEGFAVQIVLGETAAEKAAGLKLGKNARKVLESARPFPEGRWLFIRIGSKPDIADVQRLLMLKAPPSSPSRNAQSLNCCTSPITKRLSEIDSLPVRSSLFSAACQGAPRRGAMKEVPNKRRTSGRE